MFHVFLDFEMNPIAKSNKEARAIVRNEIVEIGAVKLDDSYHQIDRFSCYVCPELNFIERKITKLTGIRQQDIEKAQTLPCALMEFTKWIGQAPVKIYSWSESDKIQLMTECQLKKISVPRQFRRWMDFQRVYTRLMGLSEKNCLSLKNAIGAVDQNFQGEQHRAVNDAENAASLLTLVKNKKEFQERTQILSNVFSDSKSSATTLGDIFGSLLAEYEAQPA